MKNIAFRRWVAACVVIAGQPGDAARYLLRGVQNGRTFGYHVYFVRDGDGVWRLQQF